MTHYIKPSKTYTQTFKRFKIHLLDSIWIVCLKNSKANTQESFISSFEMKVCPFVQFTLYRQKYFALNFHFENDVDYLEI